MLPMTIRRHRPGERVPQLGRTRPAIIRPLGKRSIDRNREVRRHVGAMFA
jgi:hypothetical protein